MQAKNHGGVALVQKSWRTAGVLPELNQTPEGETALFLSYAIFVQFLHRAAIGSVYIDMWQQYRGLGRPGAKEKS